MPVRIAGSVAVPFGDTVRAIWNAVWGMDPPQGVSRTIILNVRLPRVLATALCGGALALCGAAMQGLLRNPLATFHPGRQLGRLPGRGDRPAAGRFLPRPPLCGNHAMAMLFALGSLILILSLAYTADRGMSTQTIILMGVVFSMFATQHHQPAHRIFGRQAALHHLLDHGVAVGAGYPERWCCWGRW